MNILNELDLILAREVEPYEVNELEYDMQKMATLFKTRFSEAYQKFKHEECEIFRGDQNLDKEISIVKPGKRASQNTSNYYTLLISYLLPSWKDFPKRDSSFICTTDPDMARRYGRGNYFIVFPENGANLGVCSSRDFWYSFENQLEDMDISDLSYFNNFFNEFYHMIINFYSLPEHDISIEELKKFSNLVDQSLELMLSYYQKNINDIPDEDKAKINRLRQMFQMNTPLMEIRDEYLRNQIPFLQQIDQNFLNPEKNEIQHCSIGEFKLGEKYSEIWTDASCLFINYNTWKIWQPYISSPEWEKIMNE